MNQINQENNIEVKFDISLPQSNFNLSLTIYFFKLSILFIAFQWIERKKNLFSGFFIALAIQLNQRRILL